MITNYIDIVTTLDVLAALIVVVFILLFLIARRYSVAHKASYKEMAAEQARLVERTKQSEAYAVAKQARLHDIDGILVELQGPLRTIAALADQVLSRPLARRSVRDVTKIRGANERIIMALMNHQYAIQSAGDEREMPALEPVTFSLVTMARDVIQRLDSSADDMKGPVVHVANGGPDQVIADYALIRLLISNLVCACSSNQPDRRIEVFIHGGDDDLPGVVSITFVESPGLDDPHGTKWHPANATGGQCTTLDGAAAGDSHLKVALMILAELGGSASQQSIHGYGQSWKITVPVNIVSRASSAAIYNDETGGTSRMVHARILVVDGRESSRGMLEGLLKNLGYSVIIAGTAAEAYQLLAEDIPDLAVVSCHLNGGTGLDVMRKARAMMVPVVAVSSAETDRSGCMEAGAADMVNHSMSPDRLIDAIDAAMESEVNERLWSYIEGHPKSRRVDASISQMVDFLNLAGKTSTPTIFNQKILSISGIATHLGMTAVVAVCTSILDMAAEDRKSQWPMLERRLRREIVNASVDTAAP